MINNVALLGTNGNRTKAYLQLLKKAGIFINNCILMDPDIDALITESQCYLEEPATAPYFNQSEPVVHTLEEWGIPYSFIKTNDVNDLKVLEVIKNIPEQVIVYSGFGGQIVKTPLLNTDKNFLHIHPGLLPNYRGSTTIYYSMLAEGNCGATAFFLDKHIDTGPIITEKVFKLPEDLTDIDKVFDPYIRATLLVEVLCHYVKYGKFQTYEQTIDSGETYHIIHPVLKHISILTNFK